MPSWLNLIGIAEEKSRATAQTKRKLLGAAIYEVAGHGILTGVSLHLILTSGPLWVRIRMPAHTV